MGDFVFFSDFFRISGIQGFLGSVPPPRDCKGRSGEPCFVLHRWVYTIGEDEPEIAVTISCIDRSRW